MSDAPRKAARSDEGAAPEEPAPGRGVVPVPPATRDGAGAPATAAPPAPPELHPELRRLRRPRGRLDRNADGIFRWVVTLFGASVLLILGSMIVRTTDTAWPAFQEFGLGFITGSRWAPSVDVFGALAFIFGTALTSVIALVLAVPVALGIALFINELAPSWVRSPLIYTVELLAAVPSVVYGLWGVLVLLPFLEDHFWIPIADALGWIPIFAGPAYGRSFATAGVILAIMIVPIVSAIAREVMALVPRDQREAAYALGATRWEMIRMAILPYARGGIVGAVMLGFGRAVGETIAVALVIGGIGQITASIFQPGSTIAAVIATQFNEASGLQTQALVGLGVVLFLITVLINIAGRLFIARADGRLLR